MTARVPVSLFHLLLAAAPVRTLAAQQPPPMDSALRAELVHMGREDQEARDGFGAAMAGNDTAFARRLMQGDSTRTVRLREIVRRHGWPGRSLVGEDGAQSAWLVLQHSSSVEFQREMVPVLWRAAARGEVRKADVAMLEDRVLVRDGRPQRYGNSFSLRDGRLVPDPIEELPGLDARRAEVGLPAMAEYVRVMGEAYGMPVTWPPSP
jgi:hypothetical protein